jgi:hypothetical protein
MTNDERITIPRRALEDLMDAAAKYLDILGRQGVKPEAEEQLLQAMCAHGAAAQAITAACQRAILEVTPTSGPLH